MKNARTKKKKTRVPRQTKGNVNGDVGGKEDNEEHRILNCLAETFSLASLDEVTSAYREAEGDANKSAEILGFLMENVNDPSTSSSSSERFFDSNGDDPSTSSSSSSSDRFFESDVLMMGRAKGFGGNKQKRVVASAGTVSNVLGKDYVRSTPSDRGKRYNFPKCKGLSNVPASNKDAENFLSSMLGDECELSMDVVRDVFSHCGYDVEKALDALLDLSASCGLFKDGGTGNYIENCKQDSRRLVECNDSIDGTVDKCQLPDRMSDSAFYLSEELQQILQQSSGYDCRNYLDVLVGSKKHSPSWPEIPGPGLPQKMLESLFNFPKRSENEPNSKNWKNVVRKMESFGLGSAIRPASAKEVQKNTDYVEGEEYHVFRKTAMENWDTMKSYYKKAATAYSRGERGHAAHLSEQGRVHNKIAREADEKASQEIFEARNKGIQNMVTIDLHGQHVKQAMRLLKVHLLLFTTYIPSVQFLKVITGCGSHGVGKGKLKHSVIGLVKKAGIEWSEENRGTVVLKLDGQREFTFMDSDGESD